MIRVLVTEVRFAAEGRRRYEEGADEDDGTQEREALPIAHAAKMTVRRRAR